MNYRKLIKLSVVTSKVLLFKTVTAIPSPLLEDEGCGIHSVLNKLSCPGPPSNISSVSLWTATGNFNGSRLLKSLLLCNSFDETVSTEPIGAELLDAENIIFSKLGNFMLSYNLFNDKMLSLQNYMLRSYVSLKIRTLCVYSVY